MVERYSHAQPQQGSEAADGGAKQHHPVESVGGCRLGAALLRASALHNPAATHAPISPALQPPTACSCSTRNRARACHPAATSRWGASAADQLAGSSRRSCGCSGRRAAWDPWPAAGGRPWPMVSTAHTVAAPHINAQVIVSSDYGETWTAPQLIYAHEAEDEVPKVRLRGRAALQLVCVAVSQQFVTATATAAW